MAKPKKSKLLGETQGQQAAKRNPKKAKIFKVDDIPIEAMASVASSSSSVETLELGTLKSLTSSRNSLVTPLDPYVGTPASAGSRSESLAKSSSRQSPRKATVPARSHISISSKVIRGKIRQDSETSIPYINRIKKRPKVEEIPIEQTEIYSSSESEEDEQVRATDEANFPENSEGEKSHLSSEDEAVVTDLRVRFDELRGIIYVPNWDELSATSYPSQIAGNESGVDEMTVQSEMNYDYSSVEEPRSVTDFESLKPEFSSSEIEFSDEAVLEFTPPPVQRPRVELVDPMESFIHVRPLSSTDSLEPSHKELHPAETYQTLKIYVYELVNKVVNLAEQGEHRLKENLDKLKLLKQIRAEIEDKYHEKCRNEYLTKRLTGLHQRRFKYSLITPSTNESDCRHYQDALNVLDFWLNKEQEAEKIYQTERDRLELELEERRSQDEQEIKGLEDRIWDSLLSKRQSSHHLKFAMNHIFRQMRQKRDEMSETRLDLIIKQHTNSYVKQKIDETETISEELKMHTYQTAEVEVNQLGKVLSMRTAEVNGLSCRIINQIHIISHLRCRRRLLNRNFRLAKDELLELRKKHFELRSKTYQIHMKHNRVLARIKEVRQKGGLIHYPLLLQDYDETKEIVLCRRKRVSLMRTHYDSLLLKIKEVELVIQQSMSRSTLKE